MDEKPKAKIETRPWDAAEHLETDADMAAYLEAALEEGDAFLVAAALGDIARAKGHYLDREGDGSLYKALSPEGNPELATVLKVVRSLGLRLAAKTAGSPHPDLARPPGSGDGAREPGDEWVGRREVGLPAPCSRSSEILSAQGLTQPDSERTALLRTQGSQLTP